MSRVWKWKRWKRLQITTKLTSPTLTKIHRLVALVIYVAVFVIALILAYAVNSA